MLFTRPTRKELHVPRTPVDGERCPDCGSEEVAAYPLLRVTGWKLVARCQSCLATLAEEEPASPFGFTYTPYSVYVRELRGE